MRQLVILIILVSLLAACDKDGAPSEAALYGTWVKGNQAGDTLQFLRKNGKDIMLQNESFNAGCPLTRKRNTNTRTGN